MASRFDTNKLTKNVKFMGVDVAMRKLSVGQVLQVQEKAKALSRMDDGGDADANIEMLTFVIRAGVEEMSSYTNEEFLALPMDELSSLSSEILKYSGLHNKEAK